MQTVKISGNRPTRYYSKVQERRVAKVNNGSVVANSGATRFNKGDVKTDHFLIECKTKTDPSKSISIKKDWLEKTKEEAFNTPNVYRWALAFNFGPDEENYYIIDENTFKEFNRILDAQEEA